MKELFAERYGYIKPSDELKVSDADILPDAGSVTHEEAEAKALGEYEKFWRTQDQTILSDFDKLIEDLCK